MRIGIITLSLNTNYGGILQAQVLKVMPLTQVMIRSKNVE